jgi:hypothetical protein
MQDQRIVVNDQQGSRVHVRFGSQKDGLDGSGVGGTQEVPFELR